jgi:SPP1 family predicted phage head-tail adaptor
MDAGRFNRSVTIQRRVSGVDAFGQPYDETEDVATVRADIRHTSGLEAIKAGAEASIVKASVRIRYRLGIDAGMTLLVGAVVYEIKAVMPDVAGRKFVDLVCEVVT